MTPQQTTARLDLLASMKERLQALADEMENSGIEGLEAMADHLDCIVDEVEFQQGDILKDGPVVHFRNGKCVVRYASEG